jgi:hypothetical protein
MPEQMNSAFLQAVLDYTRSPTTLDEILENLDEVQRRTSTGTELAP